MEEDDRKQQKSAKNKKPIFIAIGAAALVIVGLILFFAFFNKKTHVVSFNSEGGSSVEQVQVKQGELVELPENPSKSGFKFNGWLLDGKLFAPSSKITSDIELVASWIPEDAKTHRITFDADNGSSPIGVEVIEGTPVAKPSDPTKDKFTFKGWFAGDESYDFSNIVEADLTLRAHWEEVEPEADKDKKDKKAEPTTQATPSAVLPSGISLNKTVLSLRKGTNATLAATVSPSNATNKTVTWSSSNTNVATANGGVVTAVAKGSALITAKTVNGKTATAAITVTNPVVKVSLAYNRAAIFKGLTTASVSSLIVTPTDADGKDNIEYFGSFPDGQSGCLSLSRTTGVVGGGATYRPDCVGRFWATVGGVRSSEVTIIGEFPLAQPSGANNWQITLTPNETRTLSFGGVVANFSNTEPVKFTFSPASGSSTTIKAGSNPTSAGNPGNLQINTPGGQTKGLVIYIRN